MTDLDNRGQDERDARDDDAMTADRSTEDQVFLAQAVVEEELVEEPGEEEVAEEEAAQPEGEAQPEAQAAAVNQIIVNKPPAGQAVTIEAQGGLLYVMAFDPNLAQVQIQGQDFVLLFGDGSQIVFQNLVGLAQIGQAPLLQVGGITIGGAVILAQAEALGNQPDGSGPPTLETAAGGQGPLGGGRTEYQDDPGTLISVLDAEGPIPFVEGGSELVPPLAIPIDDPVLTDPLGVPSGLLVPNALPIGGPSGSGGSAASFGFAGRPYIEDTPGTAVLVARVANPGGDEELTEIRLDNLPTAADGWTISWEDVILQAEALGGTVDKTLMDQGTIIVQFPDGSGVEFFQANIEFQPPVNSDVDFTGVSVTTSARNAVSGETAQSDASISDLEVDAVVDGTEVLVAGQPIAPGGFVVGDITGLITSLQLTLSPDDLTSVAGGTADADAPFTQGGGDVLDGSETVTQIIVTLTGGDPATGLPGLVFTNPGSGISSSTTTGGNTVVTTFSIPAGTPFTIVQDLVSSFAVSRPDATFTDSILVNISTTTEETNLSGAEADTSNNSDTDIYDFSVVYGATPTADFVINNALGYIPEDTPTDIQFTAVIPSGSGDNVVTQIVISNVPGTGSGWIIDTSALDAFLAGLSGTNGAVFDAAAGTITITLDPAAGVTNFDQVITVTPPTNSDVDISDLTVVATATNTISGGTVSSNPVSDNVIVDAVVDGSEVTQAPLTGGAAGVAASLNLTLDLGGDSTTGGTPGALPFESQGGSDDADASESVTAISVTLSEPAATLLFTPPAGVVTPPAAAGDPWVFDTSGLTQAQVEALVASFQVDPPAGFAGVIGVVIETTTSEAATVAGGGSVGGGDAEAFDGDNVDIDTYNASITFTGIPTTSLVVNGATGFIPEDTQAPISIQADTVAGTTDVLTEIVVTGLPTTWTFDTTALEAFVAGLAGTNSVSLVAGTLTITLDIAASVTSFDQDILATPLLNTDVDAGGVTISATATNPATTVPASSTPVATTVVVDAIVDGTELFQNGAAIGADAEIANTGTITDLNLSLDPNDLTSIAGGTADADAPFTQGGADQDGSETVTEVQVVLTFPDVGAGTAPVLLFTLSSGITSTLTGVSSTSATYTFAVPDGVSLADLNTFLATAQLEVPAGYDDDVEFDVTTTTTETLPAASGAEPDNTNNVDVDTYEFKVDFVGTPSGNLLVNGILGGTIPEDTLTPVTLTGTVDDPAEEVVTSIVITGLPTSADNWTVDASALQAAVTALGGTIDLTALDTTGTITILFDVTDGVTDLIADAAALVPALVPSIDVTPPLNSDADFAGVSVSITGTDATSGATNSSTTPDIPLVVDAIVDGTELFLDGAAIGVDAEIANTGTVTDLSLSLDPNDLTSIAGGTADADAAFTQGGADVDGSETVTEIQVVLTFPDVGAGTAPGLLFTLSSGITSTLTGVSGTSATYTFTVPAGVSLADINTFLATAQLEVPAGYDDDVDIVVTTTTTETGLPTSGTEPDTTNNTDVDEYAFKVDFVGTPSGNLLVAGTIGGTIPEDTLTPVTLTAAVDDPVDEVLTEIVIAGLPTTSGDNWTVDVSALSAAVTALGGAIDLTALDTTGTITITFDVADGVTDLVADAAALVPALVPSIDLTPPLNSDADITGVSVSVTGTDTSSGATGTGGTTDIPLVVDAIVDGTELFQNGAAVPSGTEIANTGLITALNLSLDPNDLTSIAGTAADADAAFTQGGADIDGSETVSLIDVVLTFPAGVPGIPVLLSTLATGITGGFVSSTATTATYSFAVADGTALTAVSDFIATLQLQVVAGFEEDVAIQVTTTTTETGLPTSGTEPDTTNNSDVDVYDFIVGFAGTPTGDLLVDGQAGGTIPEDTLTPVTLTAAVDDATQEVVTSIVIAGLPTSSDNWTVDASALQAAVVALGGTIDLTNLDTTGTIVITFDQADGVTDLVADAAALVPALVPSIDVTPPTNSDEDFAGVSVSVTGTDISSGATATGGTPDIPLIVDAIVDGTEVLLDGSEIAPAAEIANTGASTDLRLSITDLQDSTSLTGGTNPDPDAAFTQGGGDADGSETVTQVVVELSVPTGGFGLPTLAFTLPAGITGGVPVTTATTATYTFTIPDGTTIADVNSLIDSFAVEVADPTTFGEDVTVTLTTTTSETALNGVEPDATNNTDVDSYQVIIGYVPVPNGNLLVDGQAGGTIPEDTPTSATVSAAVANLGGDDVLTEIVISGLPAPSTGWTIDPTALADAVSALGGSLLYDAAAGTITVTFPVAAGITDLVAQATAATQSATILLTPPTNSDEDFAGVEVSVTATDTTSGATATGGTPDIPLIVDAIVDGTEVLLDGSEIVAGAEIANTGASTDLQLSITDLQDSTSLTGGTNPDPDAAFTQGGGDADGSETVTQVVVQLSVPTGGFGLPTLGFTLPAGITGGVPVTTLTTATYTFTIPDGTTIADVNSLIDSFAVEVADPTTFAEDVTVTLTTTTSETALNGVEPDLTNNTDVDSYSVVVDFSAIPTGDLLVNGQAAGAIPEDTLTPVILTAAVGDATQEVVTSIVIGGLPTSADNWTVDASALQAAVVALGGTIDLTALDTTGTITITFDVADGVTDLVADAAALVPALVPSIDVTPPLNSDADFGGVSVSVVGTDATSGATATGGTPDITLIVDAIVDGTELFQNGAVIASGAEIANTGLITDLNLSLDPNDLTSIAGTAADADAAFTQGGADQDGSETVTQVDVVLTFPAAGIPAVPELLFTLSSGITGGVPVVGATTASYSFTVPDGVSLTDLNTFLATLQLQVAAGFEEDVAVSVTTTTTETGLPTSGAEPDTTNNTDVDSYDFTVGFSGTPTGDLLVDGQAGGTIPEDTLTPVTLTATVDDPTQEVVTTIVIGGLPTTTDGWTVDASALQAAVLALGGTIDLTALDTTGTITITFDVADGVTDLVADAAALVPALVPSIDVTPPTNSDEDFAGVSVSVTGTDVSSGATAIGGTPDIPLIVDAIVDGTEVLLDGSEIAAGAEIANTGASTDLQLSITDLQDSTSLTGGTNPDPDAAFTQGGGDADGSETVTQVVVQLSVPTGGFGLPTLGFTLPAGITGGVPVTTATTATYTFTIPDGTTIADVNSLIDSFAVGVTNPATFAEDVTVTLTTTTSETALNGVEPDLTNNTDVDSYSVVVDFSGIPTGDLLVNGQAAGAIPEDTLTPVTLTAAVGDATQEVVTSIVIGGLPTSADNWTVDASALQAAVVALGGTIDLTALDTTGTITITFDVADGVTDLVADAAALVPALVPSIDVTPPLNSDADFGGVSVSVVGTDATSGATATGGTPDITLVVDAIVDGTELFQNGAAIAAGAEIANTGLITDLDLSLDPNDLTSIAGTAADADAAFTQGGADQDGSETVTQVDLVLTFPAGVPGIPVLLSTLSSGITGGLTGTTATTASYSFVVPDGVTLADLNVFLATLQLQVPAGFEEDVAVSVTTTTTETGLPTSGAEPDTTNNTDIDTYDFTVGFSGTPTGDLLVDGQAGGTIPEDTLTPVTLTATVDDPAQEVVTTIVIGGLPTTTDGWTVDASALQAAVLALGGTIDLTALDTTGTITITFDVADGVTDLVADAAALVPALVPSIDVTPPTNSDEDFAGVSVSVTGTDVSSGATAIGGTPDIPLIVDAIVDGTEVLLDGSEIVAGAEIANTGASTDLQLSITDLQDSTSLTGGTNPDPDAAFTQGGGDADGSETVTQVVVQLSVPTGGFGLPTLGFTLPAGITGGVPVTTATTATYTFTIPDGTTIADVNSLIDSFAVEVADPTTFAEDVTVTLMTTTSETALNGVEPDLTNNTDVDSYSVVVDFSGIPTGDLLVNGQAGGTIPEDTLTPVTLAAAVGDATQEVVTSIVIGGLPTSADNWTVDASALQAAVVALGGTIDLTALDTTGTITITFDVADGVTDLVADAAALVPALVPSIDVTPPLNSDADFGGVSVSVVGTDATSGATATGGTPDITLVVDAIVDGTELFQNGAVIASGAEIANTGLITDLDLSLDPNDLTSIAGTAADADAAFTQGGADQDGSETVTQVDLLLTFPAGVPGIPVLLSTLSSGITGGLIGTTATTASYSFVVPDGVTLADLNVFLATLQLQVPAGFEEDVAVSVTTTTTETGLPTSGAEPDTTNNTDVDAYDFTVGFSGTPTGDLLVDGQAGGTIPEDTLTAVTLTATVDDPTQEVVTSIVIGGLPTSADNWTVDASALQAAVVALGGTIDLTALDTTGTITITFDVADGVTDLVTDAAALVPALVPSIDVTPPLNTDADFGGVSVSVTGTDVTSGATANGGTPDITLIVDAIVDGTELFQNGTAIAAGAEIANTGLITDLSLSLDPNDLTSIVGGTADADAAFTQGGADQDGSETVTQVDLVLTFPAGVPGTPVLLSTLSSGITGGLTGTTATTASYSFVVPDGVTLADLNVFLATLQLQVPAGFEEDVAVSVTTTTTETGLPTSGAEPDTTNNTDVDSYDFTVGFSGTPTGDLLVGGQAGGTIPEDTLTAVTLTAAVGDPTEEVVTSIVIAGLPTSGDNWTVDASALQTAVLALGGTIDLTALDTTGTITITFDVADGITDLVADAASLVPALVPSIDVTPPANSDVDFTGVSVSVTGTDVSSGATATGGTPDIPLVVDAIVDGTEVLLDGSEIAAGAEIANTGASTDLQLSITDLQDSTSLTGGTNPDPDAAFTQGGGDADGSETVTQVVVQLSVPTGGFGLPTLGFTLPAGITGGVPVTTATTATYTFTIPDGTTIADVNSLIDSFAVGVTDPATFAEDVTVTLTTTTSETALNGVEPDLTNNTDVDSYQVVVSFSGIPTGDLLVNGQVGGVIPEDTLTSATLAAAVADPATEVVTQIVISDLPVTGSGWTIDVTDLTAAVTALGGSLVFNAAAGTITITFDVADGVTDLVADAGAAGQSATLNLTPPTNSDADFLGVDVTVTGTDLVSGATASGGTDDITLVVDAIVDGTEVTGSNLSVKGNDVGATALGLNINLLDQTSIAAAADADAPFTQGGADGDGSETVSQIAVTLTPSNLTVGLPVLGFTLPAGITVDDANGVPSGTGDSVTWTFTIPDGTDISVVDQLVQSLTVDPPATFAGTIDIGVETTTVETGLPTSGAEPDTTNNTDVDNYLFTLTVDPAPVPLPDPVDVNEAIDVNLTFVIDRSGSMGFDSGVDPDDITVPDSILAIDPNFATNSANLVGNGNYNRLALSKIALVQLLEAYEGTGSTVNVLLVQFDTNSETLGGGWIEDDLSSVISTIVGITVGGGTNYEAALEETIDSFPDNTPTADRNLLYFLSDGEPTRGGNDPSNDDHSISDSDLAAWEAFLSANLMESLAVGIGTGVSNADDDLEDVAVPNNPFDNNPFIVLDEAGLIPTLLATVDNRVSGNVLDNDDFGADGQGTPAITQIVVNSGSGTERIFTFNGTTVSGSINAGESIVGTVLTVLTLIGGQLEFDFATGAFTYTAGSVNANTDDTVAYTIQDGNGDVASSNLVISVLDQGTAATAANDSVITRSDSTDIFDQWLVFNDTDPQGDELGVSDVAGATGGDATGGFAEIFTNFDFNGGVTSGSFTYRAHDFIQESAPATVNITRQTTGDLNGTGGDNILIGDGGADVINGLGGTDVLVGNGGADVLDGGAGSDMLIGGTGTDSLTGGTGADRFQFTDTGSVDVITDLNVTEDIVDLAQLLTDFESGDDITDFVQFSAASNSIGIDQNGTTGGSSFTNIASVANGVTVGEVLNVVTDQDGNQVTVTAS